MSPSSTNIIRHQPRTSSRFWNRQRESSWMTPDSFRIYGTSSYGCNIQNLSNEATIFGPSSTRGRSERIMHSCMRSGLSAASYAIGEYHNTFPATRARLITLTPPAARKRMRSTEWGSIVKRNRSSVFKQHTKHFRAGLLTPRA